jgi:hypothetical protein
MSDENKQMVATDGPSPFAGVTPEELAAHRPKRKIPTQTLILMLVLTVSVGSLAWMRREGTRAGITFAELKVEYKEPDAEKARTYQRIMADLARVQSPLDVALSDLGRSPFMLESRTPIISENGEPVAGPTPEERAAAEAAARAEARRLELIGMLQAMKLHSVVTGSTPLARIDDQTVVVGDTLGEFMVTGIEGRVVTLEADGHAFTLSMENAATGPKKAPVKIGRPGVKRN